jgi:hypothetical protein
MDPFSAMGAPSFSATGGDAFSRSAASNRGEFYSPFIVTTGGNLTSDLVRAIVPIAAVVAVAWMIARK